MPMETNDAVDRSEKYAFSTTNSRLQLCLSQPMLLGSYLTMLLEKYSLSAQLDQFCFEMIESVFCKK